eukprot:scaffold112105_cov51-Phaeocystis_antarctica.AAC.1
MWIACRGARELHDSASAPARRSVGAREACRSSAWHRFGAQARSAEQARRGGFRLARRGTRRGQIKLGTACRSRCMGRPHGECTVIIVECRAPAWRAGSLEPGAPPRAASDLALAARVAGEMRIIVGVRVDGLGENWDVARYVATTNF